MDMDELPTTSAQPATVRCFLQWAAVSLAALAPVEWFVHGLVAR